MQMNHITKKYIDRYVTKYFVIKVYLQVGKITMGDTPLIEKCPDIKLFSLLCLLREVFHSKLFSIMSSKGVAHSCDSV
jgi:hypothetical protein